MSDHQPRISFASGVDGTKVSALSLSVVKDVMRKADVTSVTISSVVRTTRQQAVAMYDNVQNTSLAAQHALYGTAGDKVLDVYEKGRKAGLSRDAIILNMTKEIEAVGPEKVSHHAGDPSKVNVFDVGPHSVTPQANKAKFAKAAKEDPRVSQFFEPPNDPGYHFEIPQH